MPDDPRQVLQRLCDEHGEDYATLSRMLGRNSSYINQFLRRGVPRRLHEEERRKLARYFAVPEKLLGGPAHESSAPGGLIGVARHPSVDHRQEEPGALSSDPCMAFDERWLKALMPTTARKLALVLVEGDAMVPTLNAGDDVLVDFADGSERLRDGIYAIQKNGPLIVRRIAINPITQSVTVQSDNGAYPDWPDCRPNDVGTVGRIVWFGRRMP